MKLWGLTVVDVEIKKSVVSVAVKVSVGRREF